MSVGVSKISAAAVGKLRTMTGAGLMNCKKALTETGGDLQAAVDVLRKRGIHIASKKAGRTANEGVISHCISPDSQSGILVEVNCETDFVAKNDAFREFCNEVSRTLLQSPNADLEAMRTAQVAKMGENIQLGRKGRLHVSGTGLISAYIHTGAKVGVLVEVGAKSHKSLSDDSFISLVKDITLQIAAANPLVVRREDLDVKLVEKEREIAKEQAKRKPPKAVEMIIKGKLEKYYQNTCLEDQGFIRCNEEISVRQHMNMIGKRLDDDLVVRRFLRFQVGEDDM